jgi:hypothetical protein
MFTHRSFTEEQTEEIIPRIELLFADDEGLKPAEAEYLKLAVSNSGFQFYTVKYVGFPLHKEIIFSISRPIIRDQYDEKLRFTLTEEGCFTKDNSEPAKDGGKTFITHSNQGYLPGEKIYTKYETADGEFIYECIVEPYPIVIEDQQGKKLAKAELITFMPAFYRITLENPQEKEKIKMISKSGSESFSCNADIVNGIILYSPDAKADSVYSCVGNLQIIRESGETIKFKLPWGEQFVQCVLKGKRIPY